MKLTEQQMDYIQKTYFESDCYGFEGNVFMIDGHISVQTILDAAEAIKCLMQ